METNDVLNFREFINKIIKYKFLMLIITFILPTLLIIWETNKKIVLKTNLTIYPLTIIEFEKNFPEFSYNETKFDKQIIENIDSLYSLNFSPLNFLNSYSHELKDLVLNNSMWNKEFTYLRKIHGAKSLCFLYDREVLFYSPTKKKYTSFFI